MVDIEKKDFHMADIFDMTRLDGIMTKYKYRFHGLTNEDNPAIYIGYVSGLQDIAEKLKTFFAKNGFEIEVARGEEDVLTTDIRVGLRRDVRKHLPIAAAIIKTIVYAYEGRLDVDTDFKLKLPKFGKEPVEV